jgi:Arc/MetJ-type ribon-helix-helix transcriptional regulator
MTVRVVLELATAEAIHLAELLRQLLDLLQDSAQEGDRDPAVLRLAPDAYPDDAEASGEFRSVTRDDLLDRRRDDAQRLLAQLATVAPLDTDPETLEEMGPELAIGLEPGDVAAWLRTLTALRLVIATRLGIATEDVHDPDDPRYGIYDWLGFRLDGLLRALE